MQPDLNFSSIFLHHLTRLSRCSTEKAWGTHNVHSCSAVQCLNVVNYIRMEFEKIKKNFLCVSGAETRFSVTAESNGMLCIPLQRNIM